MFNVIKTNRKAHGAERIARSAWGKVHSAKHRAENAERKAHSAKRIMPSALSFPLYALHHALYALYSIFTLRHAPRATRHALCAMLFALCTVLFADPLQAITILEVENRDKPIANIDVWSKADVSEKTIYLKDIADTKAKNELKDKIGNIRIGMAPSPGNSSKIPRSRIISIIRSINWLPENTIISVPDSVWITRSFQIISDEKLRNLFCNYIAEKTDDHDCNLKDFKVRGKVKFPIGDVTLNVVERNGKSPVSTKMMGRVSMTIKIYVEGKESGQILLSGWVDRYEDIVCASHPIFRGTILLENDLHMERVNISKAPSNLITSLNDAVGKRLKQNSPQGAYIKERMLEIPPLIYKGDRVKLIVKSGPLTVVTTGLAKSNGAKGDQIQVKNLSSSKIVVGHVSKPSTVEVFF